MRLKDFYDYSQDDIKRAKKCSDEIVNIINKYDLKPIPLEAMVSTLLKSIREEISKTYNVKKGDDR